SFDRFFVTINYKIAAIFKRIEGFFLRVPFDIKIIIPYTKYDCKVTWFPGKAGGLVCQIIIYVLQTTMVPRICKA
ncbi:hypothetical protein, partial [Liquorilactobacillus satsumensis]|uniref:hypothetical protein n=1 Tax=Liquorilactobacillus satsumensis TaxID=259059 RepID=UPI0039EB4E25